MSKPLKKPDSDQTKAFKFRSFTEQIASLKIDVVHRFGSALELSVDKGSFFQESLEKWRELNCTIPFVEFHHGVSNKAASLVQVIHQKDEILDVLKRHLIRKDPLELEPLLDLLVQLAKDLQADFYPHFLEFFPILVSICNIRDISIVEKSFMCLAYLFKFLWRYMLKDITNVYRAYSELLLDSQKSHVRKFAVESFGFLLRKVKNVQGLCEMVLKSVAKQPEMAEGVGMLLFEVCKGVQKQFHSCSERVLPVLLTKFCDASDSTINHSDSVFQTLCKMFELMAEHTHKEFSLPMWTPLLDSLNAAVASTTDPSSDLNPYWLNFPIHIVEFLISWRNGSQVPSSVLERICKIVLNIIDNGLLFKAVAGSKLLQLVASLLLFHYQPPLVDEMVKGIFNHSVCVKEVLGFSLDLFDQKYPRFVQDILPQTVTYCEDVSSTMEGAKFDEILLLITKLYTSDDESHALSLPDSLEGPNMIQVCIKIVQQSLSEDMSSGEVDWERLWAALKCLTHLRPSQETLSHSNNISKMTHLPTTDANNPNYHEENLFTCCSQIFDKMWMILGSEEGNTFLSDGAELKLMVFAQCITALVKILSFPQFEEILSVQTLFEVLRRFSSSLAILKCLLVFIETHAIPHSVLTLAHLQLCLPFLERNLSSPSDHVRLTTLRILKHFPCLPLLPDIEGSSTEEECAVIQTCLKAEETPPTLACYRNRIFWLSKLKYSPHRFNRLPEFYRKVPLRFLLGMLYVNFSVLWDPVCELISSYACSELKPLFWEVFGEALVTTSKAVPMVSSSSSSSFLSIFSCDTVKDFMQGLVHNTSVWERGCPDHVTYRQYLWRCMDSFPGLAESKSKLFVPLLFDFIESEYGLTNEVFQSVQDISSERKQLPDEEQAMEIADRENPAELDDMEEERTNNERMKVSSTEQEVSSMEWESKRTSKDKVKKEKHGKQKGLNRTLVVMLTLMSRFTNPPALYRCNDLKQLYMRLLMNRSPEIQKLALTCLMLYKQPFLTPYRENLEQLMDDSTVQEQLLCLSSASTCCVVDEAHKELLVPVLIRILYGRRISFSKSSSSSRRNTIMRFLSSNGQTEITEFLRILMAPFINNPILNSDVDPKNVFPLKKQQSFLHEIGQLLKVIGEQIEPHAILILRIIFNLAGQCAKLLSEHPDQVCSHYLPSLKVIRQLAINTTSDILELLPDTDLSNLGEQLLSSLVWPQLAKLPQECLHHPTPLLKMIAVFSRHKQYCHLLGSCPPLCPSSDSSPDPRPTSILYFVLQILEVGKAAQPVIHVVLQIVLNLIGSFESGAESEMECVHDDPTWESSVEGLEILRPFIPLVLDYLSGAIKKKQLKQGDVDRNSSIQLEFEVLSRITSLSTDESHSGILIALLMPFLLSNTSGLKKDTDKILTTIYNLIPSAPSTSLCYRTLSKLFHVLKTRSSRSLLCDVYSRLAAKDNSLDRTNNILRKLNSWDPKRLEEPDYELRQEGFTEAKNLLVSSIRPDNGCLQTRHLLPILQNALFSVLESDDISIRDVAAGFISSLIKAVSGEDTDAFETLILGTIVPCITKGLRNKREMTLNECVDILSQLVRAYPNHPRFSDMVVLTNTNPEVDFFKNVRHIQLHRRTRAFRALSQVCANDQLTQHSLMNFLLPLASHVVFSPVSDREHNLVLEAVNVIGGVSKVLKWTNYCYLLRHYLRQLPKQTDIHKNIIRVIVSILDNFHFDVADTPVDSMSDHEQSTDLAPEHNEERDELGAEDNEEVKEGAERSLAEKIHETIMKQILPSLESNLTASCEVPAHKLSKRVDVAVSEKVRVPIAMAATKLLLHLPESSLHLKLPGLLLKVCNTLKSRLTDVREAGRDTLLKMAQSLGPRFIRFIISELAATLTRGYQLHVFTFGLHHLLYGLVSRLSPGDMDSSLELLCPLLLADIFGPPSEEREVQDIVSKTPEAKTCKSVLTFGLVARFLSPGLIPKLIKPVKEMLESQTTSKVAVAIEDIFKKVAIGVQRNKAFSPKLLLQFVHEVLTSSAKEMEPKQSKSDDVAPSIRPVDSRLLPPTPTRSNPPPLAKQSNLAVHLVTQFGLQLFKMALRRGKFKASSPKEQLEMLDPFVPILTEVMSTSRHVKLLSRALSCLMMMLHLPLPSLKHCVSDINSQLFSILKHFSYSGSASSTSQELVSVAFKCMTLILRDFTHYSISDDELRLLVMYIEQDIHNYKRQSTAFPLLKVILDRRYSVQEMHELMHKIAELSVRGDTARVRTSCRNALVQFLLNYPLGKKINDYLDFFIANLSYEEQSGRESVIETIHLVFSKFPQKILVENATYFFIPIASHFSKEESPLCRQMIAEVIKTLYRRIGKEKCDHLGVIIQDWLEHQNMVHKRLAVQLVGLLVDTELKGFEKRLTMFMPLLLKCLDEGEMEETTIGKRVEEEEEEEEESIPDHLITIADHLVFNTLVTIEKVFNTYGINPSTGQLGSSLCDQIWDKLHDYLLHPHSWVRLISSRLYGLLFASANIDEIADTLVDASTNVRKRKGKVWLRFFTSGGLAKIRQMKQCFMGQLKAKMVSEELANQAIKNLVFIAKLLLKIHLLSPDAESKGYSFEQPFKRIRLDREGVVDNVDDLQQDITAMEERVDPEDGISPGGQELRHLIYQMDRLARYEAGHHPKESMKRSCVFKWIAAVAMAMGEEHLSEWLYRLLPSLYKELSDQKKVGGEALHNLALEVVELVKGVCGKESFSVAYSKVLSAAQEKRVKRKAQYALEAVVDPEKSIKRRWRKSRQKRESRKRAVLKNNSKDMFVSTSKRRKLLLMSKRKHVANS